MDRQADVYRTDGNTLESVSITAVRSCALNPSCILAVCYLSEQLGHVSEHPAYDPLGLTHFTVGYPSEKVDRNPPGRFELFYT